MKFLRVNRLAGCVFTVIAVLFAVGTWAQSSINVRFSVDVGWSTFSDDSQFLDVVGTLGPPEVRQWSVSETLSTPHLGVNVHLGDNWVFGAKYQTAKQSTLEIRRNTTPLIDRINSTTGWSSVFVERQLVSNSRYAWHATAGATRAVTKLSARIDGVSRSNRMIEVDPMIGTGYTVKWKNWSMRLTAKRRFADDNATEYLALTFRFGS